MMRRKSSRTTRNSSPEKPKPEPQKKSRRQSSRRRKRSSSKSSGESDNAQLDTKDSVQVPIENVPSEKLEPNSDSTGSQKSIQSSFPGDDEKRGELVVDGGQSPETKLSASGQELSVAPNKDIGKDSGEEKEDGEESEKKTKGKSKGKNKSNFEQSSNNIEPETENENVQGTPQSPSNDNADNENVQNVNDTTNCPNEARDGDKGEEVTTETEEAQPPESSFVSEYARRDETVAETVISTGDGQREADKTDRSTSDSNKEDISEGGREIKEVDEQKTSLSKKKIEYSENSGAKKRITLRRSPPQSKENEAVAPTESPVKTARSISVDENKRSEETIRKKITLKRHTTEDSVVADAQLNVKDDGNSVIISEDNAEKKRRLSSVDEDKIRDKEEKPTKGLKKVKLIRTFPRRSAEDAEDKTKQTAPTRKKWGSSDWLNKLTSTFYKVDVESIKIVCPALEFLGESEATLETVPRERNRSESEHKRKASIDNKSEDSDRPAYEKQTSEESAGDEKVEPNNTNIIAMNRKISIVDDTAGKLRAPPSPAKNPVSDVLFITNLVRPFTVKQLKELLERTGKIMEDGFWTDRIKSKCYVRYESVEEAEATRNALHGVHWPIGNGKKLIIDYATEQDLQKAKNPAPTPAVVVTEKLPEKENREPERGDAFKDRDKEDRKKRDGGGVREWDLGKEDAHPRRYSRSRSRSRDRSRKHSRRSYTPEDYVNNKRQRKSDDAIPQKLMDDLFLKTKATPSIYWQPLSPEEIATKQQQRLVRMEEHKRRIEENRGRNWDTRRAPFRRR